MTSASSPPEPQAIGRLRAVTAHPGRRRYIRLTLAEARVIVRMLDEREVRGDGS